MNKYIEITFRTLLSLISLFKEFLSAIEAEPLVKEITDQLQPMHDEYMKNVQIKNISSSGVTKQKGITKNTLCNSLFPIMTLVANQAYKNSDEVLAGSMSTSVSKLINMSATDLLATAKSVFEYCDANTDSLESWGIKAPNLEKAKAESQTFANLEDQPRQIRSAHKVATQNIEALENKADILLNKRLTPMMQSVFEQKNPELYSKFLDIIQHDKVHTSRIAVKGKVIDMESKEPILNSWIEIPEANISYRPNSKYGKFQMKNLQPGTYTLTVKQENYISKSIQFSHAWGFTTKLVVELEMTDVAKQQKGVELVE